MEDNNMIKLALNEYTVEIMMHADIISAKNNIERCDNTITLNEDAWCPRIHYSITVVDDTTRLGILLSLEQEILSPNLLLIHDSSMVILGYESSVCFVSVRDKQIITKITLDSPFFQFRFFEKNATVFIIYETGVIRCTNDGIIKWHFTAHDIINGWSFEDNHLYLDFFNSTHISLLIEDGSLIQ
jgi:hypothetical protein